ncbi:Sir2 family NAD-dependent protein deacetylase [Dactylosporangium aurantiacum]|uniref:protein acetyllysine N-acetyltransferase n=1 Tax=Dactylosporangium aurantiacum TaxID=35754 RepID=A0A9Q9IKD4_9ACTN|nr:Sir2 family NAD-dependent protein deacetylase [Dactylosporangium aurantiacum]MDG6109340.1 Sir2 family NAD-dependent protein deacetylase [Dactylosporangium aurantiacum]UWZ56448.1 Sir2 family NAD-dependent protein deacetylase [Dactylosporangium aurantiacum]
MRDLAAWVDAGGVVALTGAGVSTDSGIPDFRGPDGVWTRDPEAMKLSSIEHYVADPQVRRRAWQERLHNPAWTAEPNPAHHALVDLERAGKLTAVITQNIDGLHQRAGADPAKVIELHGTLSQTECLGCAERRPMPDTLARVSAGDPDPACLRCGGLLKSATISFGQAMDLPTLEAAASAAMGCDVFLAVGTSLTVHPAAGLVDVARKAGAMVVIVNAAQTPYDAVADLIVRDPIGEVLPRLAAAAT